MPNYQRIGDNEQISEEKSLIILKSIKQMLTEAPLKISHFHITRTDNIKKNQKKIMLADAPLSGGNL